LILLTELLHYNWFAENWKKPEPMLYLALITVFFIWITNLKWEAPVETNTLYSQDNKILKKNKTKLGFRLSLSFMPLITLSQFIGWIYNFVLMRNAGVVWSDFGNVGEKWKEANDFRAKGMESLKGSLDSNDMAGGRFWGPFFLLSDARYIFDLKNLKDWFLNKRWWIVSALFFLLFLRWLVVWLQMRKADPWKTGEMSKDLRSRGIYINRLAPGHSTRNLLRKVINKIVFFWYFIVLIFNIIFDNIFKSWPFLSFFNWFGSVNIGVDLVRQIRTKYKYIKNNK
jgi:preprotein translocase subunit SecY